MKISEIIDLLKKWSEFKDENSAGDLNEFGNWLSKTPKAKSVSLSPILRSGKHITDEYADKTQFLASYFIKRMGKFVKIYTKDIFAESGLSGSDDFSFLALIDKMDKPNKKELCNANLTELTTGLDIIRKLVKMGLVSEINDENDKRAKRLIITEKGQSTVYRIYERLRQLSEDVLGDLNSDERSIILKFLERLNNYHTQNLSIKKH